MAKPIDPAQLAKGGSEAGEQTALFAWCALHSSEYPELKLLFHIPSGAERNIIVAARLKAQGVKAGVPDLFLPVARGSWYGLWVELKTAKGVVSPAQKEWIEALRKQGYGAVVCVGWIAARDVIISYLNWA
jgi:VRR-NUC domain